MPISTRPEILTTAPAQHGALDFAELESLGLAPDDMLDFSVNSNPFGPAPGVLEAVRAVPLERYPDRDCLALRRALADHLDVRPEQIVAGNGAAELLWLVGFAFLSRGEAVLIIGPTFGEYSRSAALMGARLHHWLAQPGDDFAVHPAQVAQTLQAVQPKALFLCNPNNPTGQLVAPTFVAEWAAAWPATLFVIDEAYLAFAPAAESCLGLHRPNILIIRSMTKDYALAGLRLGYAVSVNRGLIVALAQARPAWNVNAIAQAAGVAALADTGHWRQSLAALQAASHAFKNGLMALGRRPVPSATHYFVMPVGRGAVFRQALLKQGLLVRDCASFGLPDHVRIAARRPEENQRLLTAVADLPPHREQGA
jgi:histidinol-phosphate aminotransferase